MWPRAEGKETVTDDFDIRETRRFSRRIGILGARVPSTGGVERTHGLGVLPPFSGQLDVRVERGRVPSLALSYLTLEPLIAAAVSRRSSAAASSGFTDSSGVDSEPGGTDDGQGSSENVTVRNAIYGTTSGEEGSGIGRMATLGGDSPTILQHETGTTQQPQGRHNRLSGVGPLRDGQEDARSDSPASRDVAGPSLVDRTVASSSEQQSRPGQSGEQTEGGERDASQPGDRRDAAAAGRESSDGAPKRVRPDSSTSTASDSTPSPTRRTVRSSRVRESANTDTGARRVMGDAAVNESPPANETTSANKTTLPNAGDASPRPPRMVTETGRAGSDRPNGRQADPGSGFDASLGDSTAGLSDSTRDVHGGETNRAADADGPRMVFDTSGRSGGPSGGSAAQEGATGRDAVGDVGTDTSSTGDATSVSRNSSLMEASQDPESRLVDRLYRSLQERDAIERRREGGL